jgi:hypothetical protein
MSQNSPALPARRGQDSIGTSVHAAYDISEA